MRGKASKVLGVASCVALLSLMLPVSASSVAPTTPKCPTRLTVKSTNKPGSCFIDERVTNRQGVLQYQCGDGPASATFGSDRFEGAVKDGQLSIELKTEFPFSDHCKWQSTQRIEGTMQPGGLVFTYTEAPLPGQKGCASACTASGAVALD